MREQLSSPNRKIEINRVKLLQLMAVVSFLLLMADFFKPEEPLPSQSRKSTIVPVAFGARYYVWLKKLDLGFPPNIFLREWEAREPSFSEPYPAEPPYILVPAWPGEEPQPPFVPIELPCYGQMNVNSCVEIASTKFVYEMAFTDESEKYTLPAKRPFRVFLAKGQWDQFVPGENYSAEFTFDPQTRIAYFTNDPLTAPRPKLIPTLAETATPTPTDTRTPKPPTRTPSPTATVQYNKIPR